MNNNVVISYRWVICGDIVDKENELIENYEVKTIGSDYAEAKDIAIHLLNKKGQRFLQVRSVVSTGVNFAYYKDSEEIIPESDYSKLPTPYIPKGNSNNGRSTL